MLQPGGANPLADVRSELVELRAEFEPGSATMVFNVRGATVIYDPLKQELQVNDVRVPVPLRDGKQRLIIYCDRTALEVYASDGLIYIPLPFQPRADDLNLGVKVEGGNATFDSLTAYELNSAWE